MRIRKAFLGLALACQMASRVAMGQDGVCSVPLDVTPFKHFAGDLGLLADVEFGLAAPLVTKSPLADGVISAGEYANKCSFTYAENVNPGQSWPTLDNLSDGNGDLNNNLYLSHTNGFLFVAFEVTDDFLELDGPNSFQGDGVELFLNPDLDNEGDPWGTGKYQLYVDAAGTNVLNGEIDAEFNHRGTAGGIAVVSTADTPPAEGEFYSAGLATAIDKDLEKGGTYVVEFQIPLASLNTTGDPENVVPAKTGDVILVNTAIDDNDAGENAGGQNGHHLLWHADGAGSPFGAGEAAWNVPLQLTTAVVGGPKGDFNGNGALDLADINGLSADIKAGKNTAIYDVTGDSKVDGADLENWVSTLRKTWFGDANLDGEFNSSDFVQVFTTGKYELNTDAGWDQGDWNADLRFNSGDFVEAFQNGGYEKGPVPATAAVPEPTSGILVGVGATLLLAIRRRK